MRIGSKGTFGILDAILKPLVLLFIYFEKESGNFPAEIASIIIIVIHF